MVRLQSFVSSMQLCARFHVLTGENDCKAQKRRGETTFNVRLAWQIATCLTFLYPILQAGVCCTIHHMFQAVSLRVLAEAHNNDDADAVGRVTIRLCRVMLVGSPVKRSMTASAMVRLA